MDAERARVEQVSLLVGEPNELSVWMKDRYQALTIRSLIDVLVEAKLAMLLSYTAAPNELSKDLESRWVFLHVKTAVLAVHQLERRILNISNFDNIPGAVASAREVLLATCPGLKGVRDSVAHADERYLGRHKTVPIEVEIFSVESLINGKLHFTSDDPDNCALDVRCELLIAARDAVKATYDALNTSNAGLAPPDV
jgi:hypothetical protein